ncbi:putative oligosaccharyltransferase complex subunit cg9662 [Phtheirospermum japonicum]|uniref:Putative oligosaccharyltransferase complex subunit cg9662 n=1 Tax=Phtheirospermum japonicum TaxID=374723 RepID=A0A830DMM8_9LAMI|nr:putative oligosaccharyltransferase complex subunit cg9662 [Phtheirospermum japonicum]
MIVYSIILLTYFMVVSRIVYDVIVGPPGIGSMLNCFTWAVKPIVFLPGRVHGQYIIEGLSSGFMFVLGGVGIVLLDLALDKNRPLLIVYGQNTSQKAKSVKKKVGNREIDAAKCQTVFLSELVAAQVKNNISRFSGFVWHGNEEKKKIKLKEKLDKYVKVKLREFCDILDVPISKTIPKEDIIAKLIEFLVESNATTSELLAEKEQMVHLGIEFISWCSMILMLLVETKIYVKEFRWYIRFGVIYVLVGNAVISNYIFSLKDHYVRKCMNPKGRITACDALKHPYFNGLQ